nr:hypothetical protein [Marinicella sp. W31]MDC2877383.1 hypothetical protein [Marinicella sp. W31]
MTRIASSAKIDRNAIVEDGAVIGENAEIGAFCYVGANVELGDNVKLLHHAVVEGMTRLGAGCQCLSHGRYRRRAAECAA